MRRLADILREFFGADVAHHQPIAQHNAAARIAGEIRVMGDQDQCGLFLRIQVEQQIENLLAVSRIEVARRLISEQDRG